MVHVYVRVLVLKPRSLVMNMDLERTGQTQPQKPHEEESLENGSWETPTHESRDADSTQAEKTVVREREGKEEEERDAGTETVQEDGVCDTESETKDFQKKELELEGGGAGNGADGKKLEEDSQAEQESVQAEVSNTSVASASELSGNTTLNKTQERETTSQHEESMQGEVGKGDEKAAGEETGKGDEKAAGEETGKGDEKESEWLDILGNGELLKKVSYYSALLSVCMVREFANQLLCNSLVLVSGVEFRINPLFPGSSGR